MKLAFSTLGCPNWQLGQIAEAVRRFCYDGIELRAIGGDLDLLNRREFSSTELAGTREWFDEQRINISCVDTSCTFHSPNASERLAQVELAVRHSELAAQLGAPLIRVFPDQIQPGVSREETRDHIASSLRQVAEQMPKQVHVGLETHGDFARSQAASEIVSLANHPNVKLIWDVANSMNAGDSLKEAAQAVKPYLAHVHLRDARAVEGSEHWLPVLAGRGSVSFAETVAVLEKLDYDGYISFEWEKYWHPEIEEPEVALPDFMNAMQGLVKERRTMAS
jgi:sugar phosphate isomerase/epimerase